MNYKEPGVIAFGYLKLGNHQTTGFFARFVNDQVYEAQFIFRPDQDPQAIDYYNSLVADITGVYGTGNASKDFKEPYKDGDGYEITALKSGNAKYQTYWTIGDNDILVKIQVDKEGKLLIRLIYDDGKLFDLHKEQQKAQNKSEF